MLRPLSNVPRKPRIEVEGGVFHVWARGVDRARIFLDDEDCRAYLRLVGYVARRRTWHVLAYCLMGNHIHLVVETPQANLADGMQVLHGEYGRDFNDRHGRTGHLFQGRYGARLLDTDEALWGATAYVVRNPVEAGLCERPEDWPWSSHVAVLEGTAPEWLANDRLLTHFGGLVGEPAEVYARLASGRA